MSGLLKFRLAADLVRFVSHLPPPIRRKIREGFDCLLNNPTEGKPLRDELAGLWSLRVGRFRIIYRSSGKILEVVAVGPRATIYQEIAEKLARLGKRS